MQELLFPVIFVIGFLFLSLLTRNDYDEKRNLSKKGFIKLFSGMGSLFIIVTLFVVITVD